MITEWTTNSLVVNVTGDVSSFPITCTRSRINLVFAQAAVMLSRRFIWPVITARFDINQGLAAASTEPPMVYSLPW